MKEQVDKAVETMKKGGLILYPTDTVWGIGCDATNEEAVEKIYKLKRSVNKTSMIILVGSVDNVSRYTGKVPEVAWQLMEMATKPLTLILPGACGIAPNLIPEDGTIGIRVPQHDFCQAMLRRLGRPVVSTSANLSGEDTPKLFTDIPEIIKNGVDFIADPSYERTSTGVSSSLIKLGEGGEIKILRE